MAPALPLFLAGPNPRLQTVCYALESFLEFTGRWDERLSLSKRAEARAVSTSDFHNAGWRAQKAAYTYYLRRQADAVLACAERAAAHWKTAQAGPRERAAAIRSRGLGHQLKKDYPTAISEFREALELDRNLSAESAEVAIDLNWLAIAEEESGDLAAAERDYSEALRVARKIDHVEMMAGIPGNLAAVALHRKNWTEAETLAREALALSEKVGRQELIASNCHRVATALVRQAKPSEALAYAQRAVDIFTRLRSPQLESARARLKECES